MSIRTGILALFGILLASVVGANADELIIMCGADAYVCSDDWANNNYGNQGYSPRAVGHQNQYTGEQIGRQLYRFAIPPGVTQVISAQAVLKMLDNFAGFPVETSVRGLEDAWEEMVVTWNTQPSPDSDILSTVLASCCGITYTYDITAYVQSQLALGDHTICLQQRKLDESTIGGVRWFQREGEGILYGIIWGESPELHLETGPTPVEATTWGAIKNLFER